MIGLTVMLWMATVVLVLWFWSDATLRHGPRTGLFWTLALLLSGPVGLIAYLIYGREEEQEA